MLDIGQERSKEETALTAEPHCGLDLTTQVLHTPPSFSNGVSGSRNHPKGWLVLTKTYHGSRVTGNWTIHFSGSKSAPLQERAGTIPSNGRMPYDKDHEVRTILVENLEADVSPRTLHSVGKREFP